MTVAETAQCDDKHSSADRTSVGLHATRDNHAVVVVECCLVVFQLKSVSVPPPAKGSHAHGVCGDETQYITIGYSNDTTNLNITFNFVMDNSSLYHMATFSVKALFGSIHIEGSLLFKT